MRLLTLLTACVLAFPSFAHEWYPPDCCSGKDCFQIVEEEDVKPVDGGYLIIITQEFFSYKETRLSPDNHYHRCSYEGVKALNTLTNKTDKKPCFWAPIGSF